MAARSGRAGDEPAKRRRAVSIRCWLRRARPAVDQNLHRHGSVRSLTLDREPGRAEETSEPFPRHLAGVRRLTEEQVGVRPPAEPWRPVEIGDDECAAMPKHSCRLVCGTFAHGGRQLVQPE